MCSVTRWSILRRISVICMVESVVASPSLGSDDELTCYREKAPLRIESITLLPVACAALPEHGTAVYCPSFTAAWKLLADRWGPVTARNPIVGGLIDALNAEAAERRVIDSRHFVAMAGSGRDGIVEQINKSLDDHFGQGTHDLSIELQPDEFLAYACLSVSALFEEQFDLATFEFSPTHGPPSVVKCFGVERASWINRKRADRLIRHVRVVRYADDSDYAISLLTKHGVEVIVARMPKPERLSDAIKWVDACVRQRPTVDAAQVRTLRIPVINIMVSRQFDALTGCLVQEKQRWGTVKTAWQQVAFTCDNGGLELKSDAGVVILGESESTIAEFDAVFNAPFLMVLRDTTLETPLLVCWIDSTACLVVGNQ